MKQNINLQSDRSGLDELVPSRYALNVGDIEVIIISDGVLPIPAHVLAHNVEPTGLDAWLDGQFLPRDVAEWPLNVLVVPSGDPPDPAAALAAAFRSGGNNDVTLRTFPAMLRVFSSDEDTDIDRFQESALFPGDPVAIAHASQDGKWLFVVSPRYAAWVEARYIAEGTRESVFAHAAKAPYRVVTGAKPRTVFTREQPQLSELQLDMGTRVPLAEVPLDQPVNGQHPYASWILELPLRDAAGKLAFAPALLQRNADSASDYLPLTQANLLRQAFKFLGERYGWGHAYNGRDCSGFGSDV